MRTRIKFCGMTRPEDALLAADLGVDAIGLVFYPPSPRALSLAQAAEIALALPAFVSIVALFLDAEAEQVRETLAAVPVDLLQFHGAETPQFCASFGLPYMKAVSMQGAAHLELALQQHLSAKALLLDSHAPGAMGGTGQAFEWHRLPKVSKPLILAGGLNPGNVAEGIMQTRPYGVDVSSGIEASRACKSAALMRQFVNEVNRVDRQIYAASDE